LQEGGFDATATPGSRGQFDVLDEGTIVFSKATEHRFPETAEILAALR
jgi:Rdx family